MIKTIKEPISDTVAGIYQSSNFSAIARTLNPARKVYPVDVCKRYSQCLFASPVTAFYAGLHSSRSVRSLAFKGNKPLMLSDAVPSLSQNALVPTAYPDIQFWCAQASHLATVFFSDSFKGVAEDWLCQAFFTHYIRKPQLSLLTNEKDSDECVEKKGKTYVIPEFVVMYESTEVYEKMNSDDLLERVINIPENELKILDISDELKWKNLKGKPVEHCMEKNKALSEDYRSQDIWDMAVTFLAKKQKKMAKLFFQRVIKQDEQFAIKKMRILLALYRISSYFELYSEKKINKRDFCDLLKLSSEKGLAEKYYEIGSVLSCLYSGVIPGLSDFGNIRMAVNTLEGMFNYLRKNERLDPVYFFSIGDVVRFGYFDVRVIGVFVDKVVNLNPLGTMLAFIYRFTSEYVYLNRACPITVKDYLERHVKNIIGKYSWTIFCILDVIDDCLSAATGYDKQKTGEVERKIQNSILKKNPVWLNGLLHSFDGLIKEVSINKKKKPVSRVEYGKMANCYKKSAECGFQEHWALAANYFTKAGLFENAADACRNMARHWESYVAGVAEIWKEKADMYQRLAKLKSIENKSTELMLDIPESSVFICQEVTGNDDIDFSNAGKNKITDRGKKQRGGSKKKRSSGATASRKVITAGKISTLTIKVARHELLGAKIQENARQPVLSSLSVDDNYFKNRLDIKKPVCKFVYQHSRSIPDISQHEEGWTTVGYKKKMDSYDSIFQENRSRWVIRILKSIHQARRACNLEKELAIYSNFFSVAERSQVIGVERIYEELAWTLLHSMDDLFSSVMSKYSMKSQDDMAEVGMVSHYAENLILKALSRLLHLDTINAKILPSEVYKRALGILAKSYYSGKEKQAYLKHRFRCMFSSMGHIYSVRAMISPSYSEKLAEKARIYYSYKSIDPDYQRALYTTKKE
ncbi:hypothetical protein [Endozoicomonas sp.]|uniref:hypothetical protein n=1 Tax=Endozoicomonas sp. TaxID=1892382 RepID=UPI002887D486|nr:hypothetical protein [Endozoicomonas sp.]